MYVEIDSTSEVFAYVKFFVYNKNEQKYFTIQADSETLSEDDKVYVHADLRVLFCPRPREYCNHVTHKLNVCYKKSTQGWGCEHFVTIANLREGCLDNDTLTLEVEFKIVTATKYSHPRS
ncbi:unnamed protein product [Arabidopsis lyrata]|nr:unnamed protein product [Arabidopsis lyrata]